MLNIYAFSSFFSSIICILVAAQVYFRNSSNKQNRIFSLLCAFFSYWAFIEFLVRQSETLERARFWYAFHSVWPVAVALMVHFVVVYTGNKISKAPKLLLLVIYLPCVVLVAGNYIYLDSSPVSTYWGWTYGISESPIFTFMIISGAFGAIVCLVLLLLFFRKNRTADNAYQTRFTLIAISIPVTFGILSEVLLPIFAIKIPELINISFAFMAVMIGYAVHKNELFSVSPGLAGSTIIETMSEGVMVVNAALKIEIVNPMLLTMINRKKSELLGSHVGVVLDFLGGLSTVSELPQTECSEKQIILKKVKGGPFSALISWSTLFDNNKAIRGTVFVIRDITEIEHARKSLQKAHNELESRIKERTAELEDVNKKLMVEIEEKLNAEMHLKSERGLLAVTLSSIKEGVIVVDPEGKIMMLNDSAEKMTGHNSSKAKGMNLHDVYDVYEFVNGKKARHTPQPSLLSIVQPVLTHYCLHSLEGKTRSVSETCTPIIDETGSCYGSVVVFRDMTEQKKMEEELFKARKLESLSVLAGGIAGEFSTLFSGIITNLFLAKVGMKQSTEACQLITVAEKAAFKASGLISQLLTFSKDSAPVLELASIKDLLENSAGFYMNGLTSDYKLDLSPDLFSVEMDRGQIDQVLNNMIINADQAMCGKGVIGISAQNVDTAEDLVLGIPGGKYVRVSISDSGLGIPSDILTRIFDPYFTTRENGIGLGLTMAYATIRNHGGQITIDSAPGNGSTFHIFLPAVIEQEEAEEQAEEKQR